MEINRILHVFGTLNRGGAEVRTMEIYKKINKNKFQFDFVKHTNEECDFDEEIRSLGGKIHVLPRFNGINYFSYKKAWKELLSNNNEYKVIHANMLTTAFIYFPIAKKHNVKKIIAHSRSSSEDKFYKKYLAKLSGLYTDHLLAVSKEASINAFGRKKTQQSTIILNDVIDVEKYKFNISHRKGIREQFNLSNCIVYGHVGRFHVSKNHFFLLDVFKGIALKNPDSKLILVGEGPLKDKIIKRIKCLRLEKKIILTGLRSDVDKFYSVFDYFLFPSKFEGYPGAVLEAQISGLPVIMSNLITSEIIKSNLVKKIEIDSIDNWIKVIEEIEPNTCREKIEFTSSIETLDQSVKFFENFYTLKV